MHNDAAGDNDVHWLGKTKTGSETICSNFNEKHGDEKSVISKNNTIQFIDCDNYKLSINIQENLPIFDSSNKLGSQDDYQNSKREEKFLSGPFLELSNGELTI